MSFILDRQPILKSPFIIVCEGMGDVHLVNALLKHHGVSKCQVGCPSNDSVGGMGKDKISEYLALVQTASIIQNFEISGILVIGDADKSQAEAVAELSTAISDAQYPLPTGAFSLEDMQINGKPIRMGIFIIPGRGRDGTLEHLLLDAIMDNDTTKDSCIDDFMKCVGSPMQCSRNQIAKMRMSILVGALCKKNPWASSALVWQDAGNPIPVNSKYFTPLADFIKQFCQ